MDYRETVFYRYHQDTKHTPERLRRGPWSLDWATQPDPFRHYEGTPLVTLPPPQRPAAGNYFQLVDAEDGPAVTLQGVSQLLYHSMAVATWKAVRGGPRWALRVNPSSGNLHPTETHLIARGVDGLEDGGYHFRVDEFALEQRHAGPTGDLAALFARESGLPAAPLTILLTSIFWREAWKYRARAFRYCHHDLGHALAAIVEACRGLGWPAAYRHLFDDAAVAGALGLDGGDEVPGLLIAVGQPGAVPGETAVRPREYRGRPNRLSSRTVKYEAITRVCEATRRPSGDGRTSARRIASATDQHLPLPTAIDTSADLWHVARTRRSGVDFDGRTGTGPGVLGAILHRATRGARGDLFNTPAGHGRPLVRLYLYLHRIEGLPPGVYHYDRDGHALVPLMTGDQRRVAADLSLGQDIAANGAFAVSMLGDLEAAWSIYGDRGYRAVHIEAGWIGQGFYLGAESAGLNATGIGAFFDDHVNDYLSPPHGLEVVYHFTVGRAVPDPRLTDLPAYPFDEPAR